MTIIYLTEEKQESLFNQSLNINTKVFTSSGSGKWLASPQAFLFSVVNPHGLGPTKLPLINQPHAILCYSSYGPSFGGGHDLHISGNANSNTTSYSNLGNSYQCPSGQHSTFFTGAEKFSVADYEVFGLRN